MKAILFDLDGVFYQGSEPVPGAAKVVDWVNASHIPYLFVTNTTSRPRLALVEKLAGMQISTHVDHIFTPLVASCIWLRAASIDNNLALYLPESSKTEFSAFTESTENPKAVIVGDLGERWDFALLNKIFRSLIENPELPLIALGMTRYWKAEDGLRLDVGPFVSALEYATSRKAIVIGKPGLDFYQSAITQLGLPANEVLMVGDDIRGDIEGAQNAGLKTALVRTGKFRVEDLALGIQPDYTLQSVLGLSDIWE